MFPIPLATSSNIIKISQFWDAVCIYHNKPHIINRKLAGISQAFICKIGFDNNSVSKVSELITREAVLYEAKNLETLSKDVIDIEFVKNIIECYDKDVKLTKCSTYDFKNSSGGIFISVRVLLPRAKYNKCVEVVILDKDSGEATFVAGTDNNRYAIAPPFPYKIEYTSSGNVRVVVNCIDHADTTSAEWLANKLFDKILKWTAETENQHEGTVESLNLIDFEEYHVVYNKLKEKYGLPLIKVWSKKAKTDPQKYVYEDIAITSYLICLWKKYDMKDQIRFVDVGCGNGLLVNILNQEGYTGYGVDLRRRDTWDLYSSSTNLKIDAVTPTTLYAESNWIIGNHSDELTPWIPIMALKSSMQTNFFVLPCCPYELNGKKFIRTNSSVSQYSDYLQYIKEISDACGFNTKIERLKIPSTKRTCFIGIRQEKTLNENKEIIGKINEFISKKTSTLNIVKAFSPRASVEKVRNCTQLDRAFVNDLLAKIVNILLEYEEIKIYGDKKWNKGGIIHLNDLSKRLSMEELKQLKNECGGLQTLIKNHRYIFIVALGNASLREPMRLEDTDKYKNKPCWFQKNHPDGCLYDAHSCAYKHE